MSFKQRLKSSYTLTRFEFSWKAIPEQRVCASCSPAVLCGFQPIRVTKIGITRLTLVRTCTNNHFICFSKMWVPPPPCLGGGGDLKSFLRLCLIVVRV